MRHRNMILLRSDGPVEKVSFPMIQTPATWRQSPTYSESFLWSDYLCGKGEGAIMVIHARNPVFRDYVLIINLLWQGTTATPINRLLNIVSGRVTRLRGDALLAKGAKDRYDGHTMRNVELTDTFGEKETRDLLLKLEQARTDAKRGKAVDIIVSSSEEDNDIYGTDDTYDVPDEDYEPNEDHNE